jgi:hypothetical protein
VKRAAFGVAGAVLVAAAIARYPPDPSLAAYPGLSGPEGGKAAAMLRDGAALLAIDLAAYAVGRALHRLLRPGAAPSLMSVLERLALGVLGLSWVALGLAALHALQLPVIAGVVGIAAAAGAALVLRDARGAWRAPSPATTLLVAGGAALLVSPLLAAWVPDYGWDAFAYHLALPERDLFRNRIVVTPLFPHSAFPQTVEMVYLLALALGSAAAAKLVHLQLGLLAALAAFGMARTSSPRAGVLAMVILAADPLFNWELAVAYNDLAACLFALLAAAALEEWRRSDDRGALRMAAVLAGGCVAVRYTGGVVPLALAVLVWAWPRRTWRGKAAATAVLAGLGALTLSTWLLRNWVMTGNPVSPAAQSVFHAPGREYFSPAALAQSLAFARSVGFGHGLDDLFLLPVNLTLRARVGDYAGFGFRVGVLYLVGALAWLIAGRRVPMARTCAALAAVITPLWFFSFQEPRYLLPALCLLAVVGGIGLDGLLPRRREAAMVLWLVPLAALVHTQWPAALLLPWRYGYALGGLSVESFEAQDPALALAPLLRRTLGPGDRLLPVHEPRGFFFRGLDYVPSAAPELMHLVHESPSPEALAARLRALGVTHVLVNANNAERFRPWFVEGYGPEDDARAHARLSAFLARHTTPLHEDRGVTVRRIAPAVP